jgi:hypothetical protein
MVNCVQDVGSVECYQSKESKRSERTHNDRWTTDITSELPPEGFQQYVQLCMLILTLNLNRNPEE